MGENPPMAKKIEGLTLRSKKPPVTSADRILALKKEMAYTLSELAELWGMSERTIADNARKMKCMKWMKGDDGEWVEVVLHPETAKKLKN